MHKVLIADASEDWREQLERMLNGEYQVQASGDGDRVLEMIRNSSRMCWCWI